MTTRYRQVLAASAAFAVLAGGAPAAAARDYPLTLTTGSRLMLEAKVNGHPVRALLDSAAEMTLVDQRWADQKHLRGGQSVTGQGSGAATFEAKLINGVTLQALGLTLPDQTIAVTDLGDVGRRLLRQRLNVILGREIFDAARLSLDLSRRRIAVADRSVEPNGMRLDLLTEHGVETVPVRIEGGPPLRATFDLGNGAQVLVSAGYAARAGLLTDGRPVRKTAGGGLGGEATRQVVTLGSLEIAGQRFEAVEAAVDPQPSASDVNVGVALLRHFRITTDFAQHAVWLDPLSHVRGGSPLP